MPVYRTTRLEEAVNRGRLIVPAWVGLHTRIALQGFCGPDGRHEGMVFWIGRRLAPDVIVVAVAIPDCDHGQQHVQASPQAVGNVARTARTYRLGIVAQVHSHPGNDTRHSTGDDSMILMPFEGMFSVVVASYGDAGMTQTSGVGLHQYQDGRWVRIGPKCDGALTIVPSLIGRID